MFSFVSFNVNQEFKMHIEWNVSAEINIVCEKIFFVFGLSFCKYICQYKCDDGNIKCDVSSAILNEELI